MSDERVARAFEIARERYAEVGVDASAAAETLIEVPISLPCWQGDDVAGFESTDAALSGGGIQVTGSYPGRARNADELRADLEAALGLLPGRHRVNLHAIYGEFGGRRVDRDAIEPAHYTGWIDWAKARGIGLDFNATCFSHEKADDGFTLASRDAGVRDFWVEHVRRCREIGAHFGRELLAPAVHNLWIPDGTKDRTADRIGRRETLRDSLDRIYELPFDTAHLEDSVESKLFGIGSESFVVGSHEFYLAYALSRDLLLCFDIGHFHPTESVADKLSAWLAFGRGVLLHVSRGVRWDSDHVAILSDDVADLMSEAVRCGLERVRVALDFFDASIHRVGALAVGARATQKALLLALLEPRQSLLDYEAAGNGFAALALRETLRAMPFGAVWDHACRAAGAPLDREVIDRVATYEREVTSRREFG